MADQPRRAPRAHGSDSHEQERPILDAVQPTLTVDPVDDDIARISLPTVPAAQHRSKPTLADIRTLPLGKTGERLGRMREAGEAMPPQASRADGQPWQTDEEHEPVHAQERANRPDPTVLDHAIGVSQGLFGRDGNSTQLLRYLKDEDIDATDVAHAVLEFASPAGDVEAMLDGSRQVSESVLNLNPWGVAAGTALMAGGILGIVIPGSQYLRKGGRLIGKTFDEKIAAWFRARRARNAGRTGKQGDKLDVRNIALFDADGFGAFGKQHGVPNLGGLRKPVTFAYEDVGTFQIPGGLDGTFSYYELLVLRASGIDASRIPKPIHIKLQQKLARTLMPKDATDVQIFNNYLFAMVTPNQSLVNSQVIMSVMRIRSPEDMEKLANMIDWNPGDAIVPQIRREASRRIAAEYGLQSKARGGLGVAGTIDYTHLAEFAQLFKKKPKAFRKRPDKVEDWIQFNDRVAGLVKGLGTKAASLGTGIQDPLRAGIAQVDRILARTEFKTLFKTDAAERVFEEDVITDWNKMVGPNSNRAVESLDELVTLKGGESFLDRRIARLLAAKKTPRFIDGPNGRIPNPNIPKHLKHPDDPITTDYVSTMSPAYNAALMARLKKAEQTGLSGFSFSWMSWDRARGSLEPHEHWFPGLEKLPKPHREQYELFLETQREAGRLNFSRRPEDAHLGRKGRQNTPRPYANPAAGAIPSLPPVLLFSIWAAHQNDPEKREAEANDGPRT